MRERRQRSIRSESEGAPDEQPSGLTVKTPLGSESPIRKMPNTASRVATRQVRLMVLVVSARQKQRASLVSTRNLHGPGVQPTSCCNPSTTALAIAGVRCLIMGSASAHDAQYAAWAHLWADLKPSPSIRIGRLAT